jgi:L-ascorbate metabolism protein UlaG (beta-lactamase superfamily)
MIEPFVSDDAFLADVESTAGSADDVDLWWLGQSGFLVRHSPARVLIDPYLSDSLTRKYADTNKPHVRMSRRVVDPSRLHGISIITCSHGHTDHLDAETLAEIRKNSQPRLVAPIAIRALAEQRFGGEVDIAIDAFESKSWSEIEIRAVPSAHPELDRDACGRHMYLGYIFRIGSFTIYHSGDTMVFPGMEQMLVEQSRGAIDVAILPINGKVGNMNGIDAARLAKAIGARVVVPCHYDMFEFNTADPRESFVPECERIGQAYRVLRLGERMSLLEK